MKMKMNKSTKPKSLSELVAALGQAREASQNAYEAYKEQKGIEEQLRYELELELHATGLKSAKGADFTASLIEKPTVIIKDDTAIVEWLRHTPDIEADLYIGLKTTEFKTLAQTILKGTGELIPGTDIEIRESLAIRANKPKKVQG